MARPFVLLVAIAAAISAAGCAADDGSNENLDTSDDALGASVTADKLTNDLLDGFWDDRRGEFRSDATSYWINAQAFDAVLDAVERTHGKEFSHWVPKIRAGNHAQYGGWLTPSYGKTFFDDVTWMTLALIRAHDLAPAAEKAQYLSDAKSIFSFVMQKAPSSSGGRFDGLWWTSDHEKNEKATASNFGPAIAAARLFERTGDGSYRAFATKVYAHWRGAMVEKQSDGTLFVVDNIQGAVKSRPRFTYNQGLAIGAALAMSDLDGSDAAARATHLEDARGFADYLVRHETREDVLVDYDADDATISACSGDCGAFKGIAYRYLAQFYLRDRSRPDYYQVLHSSAHAIIANDHDATHGRFGTRWDAGGRANENALAPNASAVMAMNIWAELPPPK